MEDTFRHKGLRKKLVNELRQKGISDERVLEAINNVPRHLFMDSSFIEFSYKDQAFPIAAGQTISQPYTVAVQTQLLDVKPNDKILEIGTGSAYQTAVLMELGAKVYTIERQRALFIKAQETMAILNYKPYFFLGDGYEGKTAFAPFDRILITAGCFKIPQTLLDQMKTGGKLVAPVGGNEYQIMTLIIKEDINKYKKTEHGSFVFVPMLKGIAN